MPVRSEYCCGLVAGGVGVRGDGVGVGVLSQFLTVSLLPSWIWVAIHEMLL